MRCEQGDDRRYNEMIHKLSNRDELTPEKQLNWLAALTNYVSALTPECSALVEAILAWQWSAWENLVLVKAYATFFEHLVSAQAFYVVPVMRSLVGCFRFYASEEQDNPYKKNATADEVQLVHDRVHRALQRIISLIPTSTPKLAHVLSENFPYKLDTALAQTTYLGNVLRVLDYAPMLRDSLMQTIIERLLRIDVDIQVELDELDELDQDEADLAGDEDVFAMEQGDAAADQLAGYDDGEATDAHETAEESDVDDDGGDDDDGYETEEEPEVLAEEPAGMSVTEIRDLSGKLDRMITLVFEYFSVRRTRHPSAVIEDFYLLLDIFDRSILCTFKSRHTQFLLFHAASVSTELSDVFLGHLTSKVCTASHPSVIRVASASYLASFVARASFLTRDTICNMMRVLIGWAQIYVNDHETDDTYPDLERYAVFYATVQAILYIFCFRWRDLYNDPLVADTTMSADAPTDIASRPAPIPLGNGSNGSGGDALRKQLWDAGLSGLQPILTSKFNPLKICSPGVVQQFARLTRRLNFLYIYPIIERNKHLYLPQRQHSNRSMKQAVPVELEAFFPFDPYRLGQSSRYIDPLYQEWRPDSEVEDDDDEGEEEEEGDVSGEEDEVNEAAAAAAAAADVDESMSAKWNGPTLAHSLLDDTSLDDSTLAMSISPQSGLLDAQRRALLFSND
ncbi:RNA polymerase I-specific transcription initiation factor RRN3 [Syncephalis pseudoplumigaleata]|uniref:RNA polymerase I-specific transcription initiation factor RRN3 n=1 Tax=Syncephalis pseudoplumigaleata TaxID=1712513 RepID=A0A4P9Z1F5_9FUNG|nr:RNA polymerase I-specific transcription initiation factor RRN3 [Syncephalis pseudoplumigaleata]|eukprot:RKP26145.1 RNA polymerase I-specific transcription initiation factor RRN3 [Syncephalis pseudoplumigaleata]